MRYLVTGKEMKRLDRNTTNHFHVPEQILMEQAAMGFVRELLSLEGAMKKVLVICGDGNNGADGIAAARLLNQAGIRAEVFLCGKNPGKQSVLLKLQLQIYESYAYPLLEEFPENGSYDCIVDAVFGTGLSRPVSGEYARVLDTANRMSGKKAALDIASGISADTGEVLGTAFCAEDTITFSFGKAGQYLWPGAQYSGTVHIVPIGITQESFLDEKPQLSCLEESDLSLLPPRRPRSNKGTYGRLLIIAGSVNMSGAAYFSAKAAYRCGTGLVRILTVEENRNILQTLIPEAVLSVYGDPLDPEELARLFGWANAVVIGPGIGVSPLSAQLTRAVLSQARVPVLLDADALNLIAKEPELLQLLHQSWIFTPHLKEMERLTKTPVSVLQEKLLESARSFSRQYQAVCVLKDAHTVVSAPDGRTFLNLSGNNGMASAGSGDVLSGVIGALLAQGMEPGLAAALGVYIHGLAGDLVRKKTGTYAMMAEDLTEGLTELMNKVDR